MNKVKRGNIFLIFVMLINILLSFVIPHIFQSKMNNTNLVYAIREVINPGIVIVLYFFITKQNPKKILKLNRITLKNLIYSIILAISAIPITIAISTLTNIIFKNPLMSNQMKSLSENNTFLIVILITALQPAIIEEFSFRGIITHSYRDYGIKIMAVMSGLYFGMFHMNFNQFFYTAFIGIILALILYYTKSIYSTMIFHFLNNATAVIYSRFIPGKQHIIPLSTNNPIINYSILIFILVIDALIFYIIFKAFIKYNKKRLVNTLTNTFEDVEQNQNTTNINLKKIILAPSFLIIVMMFFAVSIYEQYSGVTINNAINYVKEGTTLTKSHQYDKAIADFNKAIELNPKLEVAYGERGIIYLATNKYDKAITDFNKVIEFNPKNELAYRYLGLAYMKSQRYKQAFVEYNKALKLNPKDEYVIKSIEICKTMMKILNIK